MRLTQEQLNEILTKHKKWLNSEEGGERANLSSIDLRNADLRNAKKAMELLGIGNANWDFYLQDNGRVLAKAKARGCQDSDFGDLRYFAIYALRDTGLESLTEAGQQIVDEWEKDNRYWAMGLREQREKKIQENARWRASQTGGNT